MSDRMVRDRTGGDWRSDFELGENKVRFLNGRLDFRYQASRKLVVGRHRDQRRMSSCRSLL
jgi:hypothetical protein